MQRLRHKVSINALFTTVLIQNNLRYLFITS